MIDCNPGPNCRFLNLDAASTGDGTNFGFANTLTPNADGTTINDVARWGWNVGDGGSWSGRCDTSKPAFYYAIENKWLANGRYWSEAHQYQITADGRSFRPDSSIYPHDGGSGAERAFNVDRVHIGTWGTNIPKFTFDTVLNSIGTTAGLKVGIGGPGGAGRTLKVYGNAEVTGPLIIGGYIQATPNFSLSLGDGQGYVKFLGGSFTVGNGTNWVSGAAIQSSVKKSGHFSTRKTTAPDDADLAAGELAFWFDVAEMKFCVKAKTPAGAIVHGGMSLA